MKQREEMEVRVVDREHSPPDSAGLSQRIDSLADQWCDKGLPNSDIESSKSRTSRSRGPQKGPKKVRVAIRLDPDVLERWRSTGKGWQSRANNALRRALDN